MSPKDYQLEEVSRLLVKGYKPAEKNNDTA